MMLRRLLARVMILFLTFAVVAVVTGMPQKSDEADAGQPTQITRYIIGLNAPMDAGVKDAVKGAGGKLKHDFSQWNMISADLPDNAIKGLSKNPKIKYIKEAVVVSATEDTLDWGVDRIDAEKVWGDGEDAVDVTKSTTGNGVKVAILDTGIDIDHSDLAGNVKGGWNIIADNSDFDDPNGHGTHCAGIVAAADNGFGVIGVAPEAHLYGVKVLDRRGRGTEDDVAAGILWAIENEMDIVSMSLGADVPMEPVGLACTAADDAGVLLVAAAGNDYEAGEDTVDYPGAYPEVIAVAGTDTTNKDDPESGNDYKYSNSSTGPEVEIAAPAVSILSTYSRNRYAYASGTSMATPMVAGTAALVMDANPGISSAEVRLQLNNTAEDLGDPGWDQVFGNGFVDAEAAVGTVDASPTVSITNPEEGDTVFGIIDITAVAGDDVGVTKVDFYIDGTFFDSDTTSPYSVSWDTTAVSDDDHTIEAVAYDADTNTDSDSITVTVDNSGVGMVSVEAISYNLYGGRDDNRHLDIVIRVVQKDTSIGVEGAEVTADVNGTPYTGTTGSDGRVVIYKERNVPYGTYYLTKVQNVAVDGWTWDEVKVEAEFTKEPQP